MKPIFTSRGELDSLIKQFGGERKKEKKILDKQFERISELSETNPYLKDVCKDANEYRKKQQKKTEAQIKHLESLIDYINRVIESGLIDETSRLDSLKHEKRRIQREITKIKNQK
tara:strand:- start:78 stop:422 length:345 start_codon:yes stop_codon:yes gene_type:complete